MTDLTRGKQFADTFSKFVNVMAASQDVTEAVQTMAYDHRHLQQGMMSFFMKFVEEMAKNERYDGRNEASVELAKSIMELDESVRALPYI